MMRPVPHPLHGTIDVQDGPALLANLAGGPALAAHESAYGPLPALRPRDLAALTEGVHLLGRGGAGFPFARKITAVADASSATRRPVVVVNLSEGEPASLKDAVLAQVAPHLVLDGASVTARALGSRAVHVVVPGESAVVGHAVRRALAERSERDRDGRIRWTLHDADDAFVAGQAAAVLELMAGRPNLPVTTWQPAAEAGHRGRPTLLSNAETFAHVGRLALLGPAAYRHHGTTAEPGTTLLTLDGDIATTDGRPTVVEVEFGTPWPAVLTPHQLGDPVLLGGYHGTWATPGALDHLRVSPSAMRERGIPLGAGVVLPLGEGCPVDRTSRIVGYLASQSARRCGPCLNGLPALASAVEAVRVGHGGTAEVERLATLVAGRGACAHPDGTVRLVRSLLSGFAGELALHARRRCGYTLPATLPASARMEVPA